MIIIQIAFGVARFLVVAGIIEYVAPGLSYEVTKFVVEVLVG